MTEELFSEIRWPKEDVEVFINSLNDVNIRNKEKQTLLHEAIACNNVEAAIRLIERGIDINAQDRRGLTPLHYCACHNSSTIARKILENGGDISLVDKFGNSPLWTAVFNARENYDFVKLLAEFNCSSVKDKKNNNGKSPIDFAKQINDMELVKIIS